jgi:hypothetical protein
MRIYLSIMKMFVLSTLMCAKLCAVDNTCHNCDKHDTEHYLGVTHVLAVAPQFQPGGTLYIVPYLALPDNTSKVLPTIQVTEAGTFPLSIFIPGPLFGTYRLSYMIKAVNAAGTEINFKHTPVEIISNRYARDIHAGFPLVNPLVIDTSNPVGFNVEAQFQYTRLPLPL